MSRGGGTPRKMTGEGGGGPKGELSPKPKQMQTLGQKYIHIKHGTLKNTLFFLLLSKK